MLQLLPGVQSGHSVPLNIVRKKRRSQIYIGIPRSLTLGEIKKVMRTCAACSERRGAVCEGTVIDAFTPQGQITPRFVVVMSARRRKEELLTEELLMALPHLLHAPVVPVVRH